MSNSGLAAVISAPNGGRADLSGLVQLAMAVKQQKIADADRKKAAAQQKAQLLMQNPALLVMTDPKDVEKSLKEGYGLNFDDKKVIPPQAGVPTDTSQQGMDPNAIASLGNAMQGNKAGAQAASSPSAAAANKAPGGGVNPTGNAQVAQELAGGAFQQQYGAMSGLYGGAVSQLQMEHAKAQLAGETVELQHRATQGDMQAMGRLMIMNGKEVSDSTLRAMVASSNMDPAVVSQAFDFALGNETNADKAKRFDSTLKTLSSTPALMDKLVNPTDVTAYARAVVYGGTLPDIQMKPHTLAELTHEADYEKYLVTDVGVTGDLAHLVARSRTDGIDLSSTLPKGMQALFTKEMNQPTLAGRKVGAVEKQATAALIEAEAALMKVKTDGLKIQSELSSKKYDILNDRLRTMVEADKAKHPWPDDIKQGLLNQVAREVDLQPEEVKHWYQYLTGGTSWKYNRVPDSDLAGEAAGTQPKAGEPKTGEAKREPTFAEKGGLMGWMQGHGLSTRPGDFGLPESGSKFDITPSMIRDRTLQYLKDIFYGTEPKK